MSTEHAVDPNVEAVRAKLLERSRVGIEKYGVTTAAAGLSRRDWIRHFQLECLDAAVYAEAELNAPESDAYSAADMATQGAEQFRAGVASVDLAQFRDAVDVYRAEAIEQLKVYEGYEHRERHWRDQLDEANRLLALIDAHAKERRNG